MEAYFFLLSSLFWVHIKLSFKLPLLQRARNVWFPPRGCCDSQAVLPPSSFKDHPKNHRADDKSFASDCIMYQQELWFQATITVTVTRGYQQQVPAFTSLERDIIVMRK